MAGVNEQTKGHDMNNESEIRAAVRRPFDIEQLAKGVTIHCEEIEAAYHVRRSDHKQYQLAVMQAKQEISKLTARELGQTWTIKQEGDSLRILTDEEAVDYNAVQFDRGRRAMATAHRRLIGVDRSMLSDGRQNEHDRHIFAQATQLQAITDAKRRLRKQSHVRSIPGTQGQLESNEERAAS